METKGIEPSTSWLQTSESSIVSESLPEVTSSPSVRCTNGCTSEPETTNEPAADPGPGAVHAAWPSLPAAIKAGIMAMIQSVTGK